METQTQARMPELLQVALFASFIIILAFTPFLEYIPLRFTHMAIIHLPVIIGSLMLGPKKGAFLGLVFGFTSFIGATVNPEANSFIFTPLGQSGELYSGIQNMIACFLPRLLVGIVPYYVYLGMSCITEKQMLSLGMAGLLGTLVNTALVSDLVHKLIHNISTAASELSLESLHRFLLTVPKSNGIWESVITALLVSLICRILWKAK